MQLQDKQQFAQIMFAVFELYSKKPSKIAVQMFWNVLERFSIAQVETGFKLHLNDTEAGKFPPKPADVIRHIEGSVDDRQAIATAAWQKAIDAIADVGSYKSVCFDDPAIMYAIFIMGRWENFCSMSKKEMPFKRRNFISAYCAYRPGMVYPNYFAGLNERENSGLDCQLKIVFIGDSTQAKAIHLAGRKGAIHKISEYTPATKKAIQAGGTFHATRSQQVRHLRAKGPDECPGSGQSDRPARQGRADA